MRKITSFILIMMLLISTSVVSFAANNESASLTQSEYDGIIQLINKSDAEFMKEGYTKKQIEEIKNYKKELVKSIKMYSKYSSEELKTLGFSNRQIEAFQNLSLEQPKFTLFSTFSKTADLETPDQFLSANLTRGLTGDVTMSVRKYRVSGDDVTFKATWKWDGRPLVCGFSESVGFAWTNGFTLDSYSDLDVTVTDTFKNVSHDVSTSDKDTEDPDGSCRFKWPTAHAGWLYDKGVCYLTLRNDDNASDTTMSWKYAHGTIQITGFGVSASGSSISVAASSTEMTKGLKRFSYLN